MAGDGENNIKDYYIIAEVFKISGQKKEKKL